MPELLAVLGSPRPKGNTARLLDTFLAAAPAEMQVHQTAAYTQKIEPCIGCGACEQTPGCVITSDRAFFETLERADALVIATPVYLLSFPAPLKAVFDRFQQYYGARFGLKLRPPIQKPKKAFLLVTQGSRGTEGIQVLKRQCETAFSVMNTRLCGSYLFEGTDTAAGEALARAQDDVRSAAKELFASLNSGQTPAEK